MPIYDYQCQKCHKIESAIRAIKDRYEGPICCSEIMVKMVSTPMIAPIMGGADFPGYHCPVTDKFVTSRRERRNIMAEHNLVDVGDRTEKVSINQKPKETDFKKAVGEIVGDPTVNIV